MERYDPYGAEKVEYLAKMKDSLVKICLQCKKRAFLVIISDGCKILCK